MNKDDLGYRDAIHQSLAKARGILFVISELQKAEAVREVVSPELEGFALWAVSDFLTDATRAMEQLDALLAGSHGAKHG
jgi:hypothetical protein